VTHLRPGLCTAMLLVPLVPAASGTAQSLQERSAAVLRAEQGRASTAAELRTLRTAARSRDPETLRLAVRALGRIERPSLLPDILPALRSALPEVRIEAANAVAQAVSAIGPDEVRRADRVSARSQMHAQDAAVRSAQSALAGRLEAEADSSVRAALYEAIGRLRYRAAADVERAEAILVHAVDVHTTLEDRLGVAKGLEVLARTGAEVRRLGPKAHDALARLLGGEASRPNQDPLRDARVRRLAIEALMADGGSLNEETLAIAARDPDPQVRRLAVRGAPTSGDAASLVDRGLTDEAAMVRLEAVRAVRLRGPDACPVALAALADPDTHVALAALDQLSVCGDRAHAVSTLERIIDEVNELDVERVWHKPAHALVALASASPSDALDRLPRFSQARLWPLRVYAARAATLLGYLPTLYALAIDPEGHVVEAAVTGLAAVAGHDADATYIDALDRAEPPVVRAAARALDGTIDRDRAVPALKAAYERFGQSALDLRAAIGDTLSALGAAPRPLKSGTPQTAGVNAADLRRLAAPRARVTVGGVGQFEVALFTAEAPATVLAFVRLAETGHFNGQRFHRLVPNGLVQGGFIDGAMGATNGSATLRDEVGRWPHVRGAVGIWTRGRDGGSGQLFINLVDNPRFDHEYTVFAQVLNGLDLLDKILEGDLIERIEIVP